MSKKIVFMGTPKFSVQTLEVLSKSAFEILCVYSQPPKESFRGKKINRTPIHIAAENLNLKVRTPKDFLPVLSTFVVPILPEPIFLISLPKNIFVIIKPKGIDPKK